AACLHGVATGGHMRVTDDGLRVDGADSATLYLAAATSFGGYDQAPGRTQIHPFVVACPPLAAVVTQPYAQLRQAHVEDHQLLFRRVALDLGRTAAATQPTDERIHAFESGDDPQ